MWVALFLLLLGQGFLRPTAAQTSSALFTNGTKFIGLVTGADPTEPNAAVGRNHIVEVINSFWFMVYDKSGFPLFPRQDATFSGPFDPTDIDTNVASMRRFFDPITQPSCRQEAASDVLVLYDKWADRWLLSFITACDPGPCPSGNPNRFCLLVSNTPDPTQAFTAYQIQVSLKVIVDPRLQYV